MIRSILSNFLNKHKILQWFFCLMPAILTVIYLAFYILDVLNLYSVIVYNNNITESSVDLGLIKEVKGYTENEGLYSIQIAGQNESMIEAGLGDVLYTVYPVKEDWFKFVLNDGTTCYSDKAEGVDDIRATAGGYHVTVKGEEFDLVSGKECLSVGLTSKGALELVANEKSIPVSSLASLTLVLKNKSFMRFKFTCGYDVDITTIVLSFCSNLPTDTIYYNESNKSFVKNVSSTFANSFILDSNIFIVLLSMIFYCGCLRVIYGYHELTLLSKRVIIGDIVFSLFLVVAIVFTLILFVS